MERKNSLKILRIKQGNIIRTEKVTKGKSGNNLMLTIDMELQKKWRKALKKFKGI